LWEKIQLSRNYGKAIQQLDEHLAYFPKVLIHRNKQRLTKIYQYLLRMRKIELKQRSGKAAKLVSIHRKIDQREERRERKALIAAKIERHIEKELIERLAKGTYGDIYNFPEMPYQKALDAAAEKEAEEEDATETEEISDEDEENETNMVEYVEDFESDEEEEDVEDMEYIGNGEWGEYNEIDDDHEEDDDDSSDDDTPKKKSKPPPPPPLGTNHNKRRQRPRIEIEYEEENEDRIPQQQMMTK
jgi:protein MAK16